MALPEHAPHIPHIPVPDLRGGLKWALTHWPVVGGATLTLAGAGLGIQMLTGTDRGPSTPPVDNAPVSDTFKPPKGGPNVGIVPAVEPTTTATVEAQKTPTPEAKKVVCGIFENSELCGKGEAVTWTDETDNRNYTLIGFRKGVIPPNTPIINTQSGAEFIRVDAPEPFYGKRVTIVERNVPNPLNYTFYGNIAVSETHAAYRGIGLGEPVGYVGNGTSATGRFKDFDLLVRITERDPDAPGKIRTAQREIDSKFSPIATQGTEVSGALQPTVTYSYPTPTPTPK